MIENKKTIVQNNSGMNVTAKVVVGILALLLAGFVFVVIG